MKIYSFKLPLENMFQGLGCWRGEGWTFKVLHNFALIHQFWKSRSAITLSFSWKFIYLDWCISSLVRSSEKHVIMSKSVIRLSKQMMKTVYLKYAFCISWWVKCKIWSKRRNLRVSSLNWTVNLECKKRIIEKRKYCLWFSFIFSFKYMTNI